MENNMLAQRLHFCGLIFFEGELMLFDKKAGSEPLIQTPAITFPRSL